MPTAESANYDAVLPGPYPAQLTAVKDGDDFGYGPTYEWTFQANTADGLTIIDGMTSRSFTPNAKARQWYSAILGRPVADGEDCPWDAIIGKWCTLHVILTEKGYNRIDVITPGQPQAQPQAVQQAPAPQAQPQVAPQAPPPAPPQQAVPAQQGNVLSGDFVPPDEAPF